MIIGRRDFLIGAGAAAYPRFAHAQERSIPIVGVINSSSATLMAVNIAALRKAIADGGIQEGRDFVFEYRWAEGEYERLPHLMNELLERQCAVIVADGNVAARIAKAATSTVPIVFTTGDDPVSVGLVSNLNHPGGNLTGSTAFAGSLLTKRLELLHELVPTAKIIGILVNPTNANAEGDAKSVEAAARLLNLNVFVSRVSAESRCSTSKCQRNCSRVPTK